MNINKLSTFIEEFEAIMQMLDVAEGYNNEDGVTDQLKALHAKIKEARGE